MGEPETADEDLLFHYTSASGLLGILRSRSIWATDAQFLNDASELRYGRAEVIHVLRTDATAIRAVPDPDGAATSRASLMESAADALEEGLRGAVQRSHRTEFVACLCERGDLLGQWRGYASGGGYALGLAKGVLTTLPQLQLELVLSDWSRSHGVEYEDVDVRLRAVRYGAAGIEQTVKFVRENLVPEYGVGFPGAKGWNRAYDLIVPELSFVKDPAFAEEREWRLGIHSSPDRRNVRFREVRGTLVPYIEIPLPLEAIRQIVVGPGPDGDLRDLGVAQMLRAFDVADVAVTRSTVPYRG